MDAQQSAPTRYDGLSIGLHWLSAALVLAAIALIELKGWFPKGSALRDGVKLWHFQVGAVVLAASLLRLGWRLLGPRPEPVATPGSLEARLGATAHGMLYLMLLALPLSGLLILVLVGKPVSVFGLPLPVQAVPNRDLAKLVEGVHEFFGNAMIGLVVLHAVAAMWHEYVRGDGVLRRMLPVRH